MRILGLDLGTTSVKAVEIDSAFGRFEVREYHEEKISADVPEGIGALEAARRLLNRLSKNPDRVVVSLRTARTTFRNLSLPTKDKKAISASVSFELEDDLPFALDQAVHHYAILAQTKGPGTQVHVAATLKRHVQDLINDLKSVGIDPDLVTTEAWAYRSLLNRVLPRGPWNSSATGQHAATAPIPDYQPDQPILLVQIGHVRTTLYIHWAGRPILAREIALGGRDLTLAVAQKYGVSLEQAESAKLDHGFVLPNDQKAEATPDQVEFSEALRQPLLLLAREVRQVSLSCKSLTREGLKLICLSGGGSLLPGLPRMLEDEILIPTRLLPALSALSTLGPGSVPGQGTGLAYSEHTDAHFTLAAAMGLCLVGPDRATAINLRQGDLAKAGQARELNWAVLKGPVIAASAVALSLLTSLVVQRGVYRSRLEGVNTQLERSVRSFFGGIAPSAVRTYLADTSKLKAQIKGELGKTRETAKLLGPNAKSPLLYLKDLSLTVPKDVVVDLIQFQEGSAPTKPYSSSEPSQASLTFLVSNPQVAERLATLIDKTMTGMERSKIEEVPSQDGGPKKYKVTFSGKPTDEAFSR